MPITKDDFSNAEVRRAPQMHYLRRDMPHTRPTVTARTPLLPRDTFDGKPDLLAAYDRMAALNDAMARHDRDAARCRTEATAAGQKYARDVREAMATGKDTAAIKNHETELIAQAAKHDELSAEAKRGATAHGYVFGALIADAAPELLERYDAAMENATSDITKAVEHLRVTCAEYNTAWQIRRILGAAHLFGGRLTSYRPGQTGPADIGSALATLADLSDHLDRLRSDEANIRAFRGTN